MKTIAALFPLLPLALVACGADNANADAEEGTAEAAIEEVAWLARGVDVGGEENTVPPIPIVGKKYTATVSLYAVEQSKLPGQTYRGAVLLNPGAVVRSSDMSTFAESVAKLGYITYVANNAVDDVKEAQGGPARGPIPLLVGKLIPNLADKLSSKPTSVARLPASIASVHERWNRAGTPKLVAVGHSLGGAVLGGAAARGDIGLTRVVLIGVDELVDAGFPFGIVPPPAGETAVPLVFVRGEKDGLAEESKTATLAKQYGNATVLPAIRDVNHFCIIDGLPGDPTKGEVGAPGKRAEDGISPLPSVQACVDATLTTLRPYLD